MNRLDVTEKIIATKVAKGIKWADVAKKVGLAKEWVTAGCLGQMTFDEKQAKIVGKIFGLNAEEQKWLQVVPYKGSLPTAVPTDPLIYRFYELVSVYGTTFKELIHEEFGDGIMCAIDFKMDLAARARPQGRPREYRDVGQVPAVQAVLRPAETPWKRDRRCRRSRPESAAQKVRMAEDAWNSRDPARVSLVYTETRAGATASSSRWGGIRCVSCWSASGRRSWTTG